MDSLLGKLREAGFSAHMISTVHQGLERLER
jgi:hypothetical protein